MTGRPMVDHSNGTPNSSSRFTQGHLLPSPLPPPPTSSSSATSNRPLSGVSAVSSSNRDRASDDQLDGAAVRKSHSHSVSSNPHTLASSKGSLSADNRDRQRLVRTLPPWVQSVEEDENADPTSLLLPRTPTRIRPASHNHLPTPKANAVAGRHFDHVREGTPVTITSPISEHASKWQQFAKSSDYDDVRPPTSTRGHIVDDDWMKENMPDLETPWHPIDKDDDDEDHGWWLLNASKRRRRFNRFHRTLMNHPMVPAGFRLTVLAFSCLALGLAGSIFNKSTSSGCENNSSTWLALIVDIVAIVYTTYITYDEYTSKPLGLRSHNAKMRLIFMDLFFIVFDSANLSLAFRALTDERWACIEDNPEGFYCAFSKDICVRQKVLTATLLIALVAWLMTFAVSTLRLVERVAR